MTNHLLVCADGATGRLAVTHAEARGHLVRTLEDPDGAEALAHSVAGAGGVVLIPRRGDPRRHAHGTTLALIAAVRPGTHVVLLTSFAVGYGPGHPMNRDSGHRDAERALRASGLPWTIVRPTWLTDDPAGAHAVTLTQDPRPDGMIARADLATALVAAVEERDARDKTFAVYNEPGAARTEWRSAFAALTPDAEPVGA
jgi:uncharacterized protein YbjT (DUF2867 family)